MTVEAIKDAIVHLSGTERQQLAEWFDQIQEDEWDRQMEKDFAPGGRGAHLLEEVEREIEAGNTTSLEEGLRRRREQRTNK
jgi:hypothetical protein